MSPNTSETDSLIFFYSVGRTQKDPIKSLFIVQWIVYMAKKQIFVQFDKTTTKKKTTLI